MEVIDINYGPHFFICVPSMQQEKGIKILFDDPEIQIKMSSIEILILSCSKVLKIISCEIIYNIMLYLKTVKSNH